MFSTLEVYLVHVPNPTSASSAAFGVESRLAQLELSGSRTQTTFTLTGGDKQILGLESDWLGVVVPPRGLYSQWLWVLSQVEGVTQVAPVFFEVMVPDCVQNLPGEWLPFLSTLGFYMLLTGTMTQLELE